MDNHFSNIIKTRQRKEVEQHIDIQDMLEK